MSTRGGLIVTQATPADAAALGALFVTLDAAGDNLWFHPHPLSLEEAQSVCSGTSRDLYLVGRAEGALVAYGMLRGWEEGFEVPSLGIAVDPRARGRGYAMSMMSALHAAAHARGARQVRLRVDALNGPALALYASLGYRFNGEERGELVAVLDLIEGNRSEGGPGSPSPTS
jgi:ribosomal protein S18 acetylase RimI-like enzyme